MKAAKFRRDHPATVPPQATQKVDDAGKAALAEQLAAINVELVNELFDATMEAHSSACTHGWAVPLRLATRYASPLPPYAETLGEATYDPVEKIASTFDAPAADLAAWRETGMAAVAAGEVAVLTLAGGQGTRLGFNKPKGEYNLGLPAGKTLFHMQADRIMGLRASVAAAQGVAADSVSLPWVVMTSPMTHHDTLAAFEAAEYYGVGKDNVHFFEQGTLPCLTTDGKIMLEDRCTVARAPDGNGGIYRALHESGTFAALQDKGVKYLHVFAVDNALVRVGDPVFVGYCISAGAEVGAKVCRKNSAAEKVGVLCKRGGKFAVVEYSDMPDATKEETNADGSLRFSAGNLCIHFYTMAFLASKASPATLPKVYHLANKKIPFAHPETGEMVPKGELTGNTGIKLETFIFDVFEAADVVAGLEVVREDEFAPVKNAPGSASDSPDTARAYLAEQGRKWATAAGAVVAATATVEVSGRASVDGSGLHALQGMHLDGPTVIVAEHELPGVVPATAEWAVAGAVSTATVDGTTFVRV